MEERHQSRSFGGRALAELDAGVVATDERSACLNLALSYS